MSTRFRRLTDLFVQGKAVELPDRAGYLWVQVINSYERDECISNAQIARARLILALKANGDERSKVEARLAEIGFKSMAEDLASARAANKLATFADEMRDDPDWKERMEVVIKTNFEDAAAPGTEEELSLMAQYNTEILAEFSRRELEEHDFLMRKFQRMEDEEFIQEWVEEYMDRRGTSLATQEYRLTEIWYAARFCEAPATDASPDHSRCDGHRTRIFETKAEARSAPQALQELIRSAIEDLTMEGRDPKGSGSPTSSSESSPTPNEEAETSAPSTPDATSPAVHGISA